MSALQPPGGCDDIGTMTQEELYEWKQVHLSLTVMFKHDTRWLLIFLRTLR